MTPPRAVANQHRRSTRHQQKNQHPHQLHVAPTLPAGARNSALRSFPHATIQDWNRLPSALLRNLPTQKGMQAFKEGAYIVLLQVGPQPRLALSHRCPLNTP